MTTQEEPLLNPSMIIPTPPVLRWRGPRIEEYGEVSYSIAATECGRLRLSRHQDDGAVREWDVHTNSKATCDYNMSSMFHHTGVGCLIEIWHSSKGGTVDGNPCRYEVAQHILHSTYTECCAGWFNFQTGRAEQVYTCDPDCSIYPTSGAVV